ncbi:MAG: SPL family radical SAM protein [Planctomycetota bacterium]
MTRAALATAASENIAVIAYDPESSRTRLGDLVLRRQKGRWVRPFLDRQDGEGKAFFLTAVQGCPFACAYCFLHGYLDNPATVVFTNLESLATELETFLLSRESHGARIHAAHLGEVVPWEAWTGLCRHLATLLGPHPHATLEIRTKMGVGDSLRSMPLPKNVVLSWTLTPVPLASRFEKAAPSPSERIDALRRAAADGRRVGIRLDPVLLVPGWEPAYAELLETLGRVLAGVKIDSIEIGTFRCSKRAGEAIRNGKYRELMAGELFPDKDGKWRYFWPLRIRTYRFLIRSIRATLGEEVPIRLCMEPDWVSERAFGTLSDLERKGRR